MQRFAKPALVTLALTVVMALTMNGRPHGQVGKSQGLIDPNVASESELAALPHMTSAMAKGIVDKRPFMSIMELDAFLQSQSLSAAQRTDFYGKAFVHINLNTATRDEILLVPGAGNRMAREFAEYRPWKTFAQFDKEIGKYVGAQETARLAQYLLHPGQPEYRQ